MRRFAFIGSLMFSSLALGQGVPRGGAATATRPATTRSATSRPATSPASSTAPARTTSRPKNLDTMLRSPMTLDADYMPFEKFSDQLRQITQTNLAVNWNGLAKAGVTKETPITVHWKDLPFEDVVKTLMEMLPAKGTRANYMVDENALQITTNADLAVENVSHVYDLTKAFTYSFDPAPKVEEVGRNALLVMAVFDAELGRAGDPASVPGHGFMVKDNVLAATISDRGHQFVSRAVALFNGPLKGGQLASGTQLTAPAKRTADAYKAFLASPAGVAPEVMAKDPQKYKQFNIAVLPGIKEELAKDKPEILATVNDGGVLLLGPREVIAARTSLAVYDLRDLIKKTMAKNKITPVPPQADFQAAIVEILQKRIKPEGETWGGADDLGKKPAVMIPYSGLLIVFATAETHRTIAGALQDMNK
jgi:hypothetical protein